MIRSPNGESFFWPRQNRACFLRSTDSRVSSTRSTSQRWSAVSSSWATAWMILSFNRSLSTRSYSARRNGPLPPRWSRKPSAKIAWSRRSVGTVSLAARLRRVARARSSWALPNQKMARSRSQCAPSSRRVISMSAGTPAPSRSCASVMTTPSRSVFDSALLRASAASGAAASAGATPLIQYSAELRTSFGRSSFRASASSSRQMSALSAMAAAAIADVAARPVAAEATSRKYAAACPAATMPRSVASAPGRRGAPMYVRTPATWPSRFVTTTRAGPNVQFMFDQPCPCIEG